MSAVRPIPRTVNRWTLEPIIFALPILLILILIVGIAAYTFVLALTGAQDVTATGAIVLLTVLIIGLTVVALLRKR